MPRPWQAAEDAATLPLTESMESVGIAVRTSVWVIFSYGKVERPPLYRNAKLSGHVLSRLLQHAAAIEIEIIVGSQVGHITSWQWNLGHHFVKPAAVGLGSLARFPFHPQTRRSEVCRR